MEMSDCYSSFGPPASTVAFPAGTVTGYGGGAGMSYPGHTGTNSGGSPGMGGEPSKYISWFWFTVYGTSTGHGNAGNVGTNWTRCISSV